MLDEINRQSAMKLAPKLRIIIRPFNLLRDVVQDYQPRVSWKAKWIF